MARERCLKLRPIEEAPIEQGETFGPCLLGPGNDSDWVTGWWNGKAWYGDDGIVVFPTEFGALPPLTPP